MGMLCLLYRFIRFLDAGIGQAHFIGGRAFGVLPKAELHLQPKSQTCRQQLAQQQIFRRGVAHLIDVEEQSRLNRTCYGAVFRARIIAGDLAGIVNRLLRFFRCCRLICLAVVFFPASSSFAFALRQSVQQKPGSFVRRCIGSQSGRQ